MTYLAQRLSHLANRVVKGCKRHIAVHILGLVLRFYVTSTNTEDVKAAPAVLI